MSYPESPETEDGTSVRTVLSEMARDLGALFRQELDLAKCEMAQKIQEAKNGALKLGVGVALGVAAVLVLTASVVIGFSLLLSTWMSPLAAALISSLLVGVSLGGVGYLLIKDGSKSMSPDRFVPERTLESLKENGRWAKEQF